MEAKKSLGQNFLKDPKILKKIADFAQIKPTDTVVEVGPGEGGLTALLLERARKVIAVEKDGNLALKLKNKFKKEIDQGRLEVISMDVLNYELRIKNYTLVGNIPYYITGALFKKVLSAQGESASGGEIQQPKSITFVVQKEVAERILARNKKESVLSISIKAYGKPEYGDTIKAGSFYPKPKVDSAIISVRNISKENFKNISKSNFFKILKTGFAHKRKLLIKNLAKVPKGTFEVPFDTVFKKCGISEKARAENLRIEDWVCLAKNINSL